ncbi:hypothetical protein ACFV06_25530 [Streptomyces sp. NPDC059618]|uniref:hypothetical protein n=1 Tax=Streptomyces sp. NPDC059618 TaxID=3346887 RepID=UPI0036943275
MFGKKEVHLIALSDLDDARDAVRRAQADAPAEEAAGLRRAARILDELAERGGEPRVRWARGVLERDGVDPVTHEVAAVRALRQELPGLSLVAAVELAREAKPAQHA